MSLREWVLHQCGGYTAAETDAYCENYKRYCDSYDSYMKAYKEALQARDTLIKTQNEYTEHLKDIIKSLDKENKYGLS